MPLMEQLREDGPETGWRPLDSPWYASEIVHCALCGQMVAGRVWVVDERGQTLRFCSPACERIRATYWVPRYGRTGGPSPRERGRRR